MPVGSSGSSRCWQYAVLSERGLLWSWKTSTFHSGYAFIKLSLVRWVKSALAASTSSTIPLTRSVTPEMMVTMPGHLSKQALEIRMSTDPDLLAIVGIAARSCNSLVTCTSFDVPTFAVGRARMPEAQARSMLRYGSCIVTIRCADGVAW